MLSIVFAVLFLVVLFLTKNGLLFKGTENNQNNNKTSDLVYDPNTTIQDLIGKDTDGDGIPDWEERLWGTDPTKKETTPGIPDSVAIAKLKATLPGSDQSTGGQDSANLSKTDQFSRTLFSTVAALTQNGDQLDQATVDKISASLIDNIKNSPQQKVYTLANIKVINDNSVKSIKNFNDTLNSIYKKYPINGEDVAQIMKEFAPNTNTVNADALLKLSPIIKQTQARMDAMMKIGIPQSLSLLYINLLNAGEKLMEDLNNMQLYDTDIIVSLGAASQYQQDATTLGVAVGLLNNLIKQKLNN